MSQWLLVVSLIALGVGIVALVLALALEPRAWWRLRPAGSPGWLVGHEETPVGWALGREITLSLGLSNVSWDHGHRIHRWQQVYHGPLATFDTLLIPGGATLPLNAPATMTNGDTITLVRSSLVANSSVTGPFTGMSGSALGLLAEHGVGSSLMNMIVAHNDVDRWDTATLARWLEEREGEKP